MESSGCVGLMVVVAVSGGVALFACQAHKRLASDLIKKFETEIGRESKNGKKKVRFAPDVVEPSGDNAEYRRQWAVAPRSAAGFR
ncbi:uncharacterized protein LOC141812898 [Curcuma longa]|uniref:uncharacterized protein LOC141812898 n=1 Tax=Curcuma longa TaxID=136217 RepID=UPI003D9F4234